jgi:hypothetical protein
MKIDFLQFSQQIFSNTQILDFMKILPMVIELFLVDIRTDIQTDMTMLTVAIRNFAQGPKVKTFHYRTVNLKK